MATTAATVTTTTTTLESLRLLLKDDWPQWFKLVTRRAERDKIWDYCNLDLPESASDTSTLVHRELIKPTEPALSRIKATATDLFDLTNDELKRWTIVQEHYTIKLRQYSRDARALAELDNYIELTIDRSNYLIIEDLRLPYKKLKALKQKLEPTSKQLKQSARAAYSAAQKWTSRITTD
jgi:hypothetical protein